MKQPKESLFLGKQIPQNERFADNDFIVRKQGMRYRLTLEFEKTASGATDALNNLTHVEGRIPEESFNIIVGEKYGNRVLAKRTFTRRQLMELISPTQKQPQKVPATL